jgi:hypothetical protein
MTATCDISVENDSDFRYSFVYQTVTGVPIDLTGTTMYMMLRMNLPDATVSFELTTENGRIAVTDPVNGRFSLTILQADLERLAVGVYQQSLIASSAAAGELWRIWRGSFTLNLGPSR